MLEGSIQCPSVFHRPSFGRRVSRQQRKGGEFFGTLLSVEYQLCSAMLLVVPTILESTPATRINKYGDR